MAKMIEPGRRQAYFKSMNWKSLTVLLVLFAWCNRIFCGEIHEAAAAGDLAKVKALLKANPDLVNSKDNRGDTPLLWATLRHNTDMMGLLLASNADVNAEDNYGFTLLETSVWGPTKGEKWTEEKEEAEIAMVKLLLAHDVNLNSKGAALRRAAARGDKGVADLLLASKTDINAKDKNGETPLRIAAQNCRKDMVEYLLTNGAEIDVRNNSGDTPLHGITFCDTNVAALLLAHGADVNATNNNGYTILHDAVSWNLKELVELLLANKAEVNIRNNDGWTPLHKAADLAVGDHKDALEIMKLLLANGADTAARDHNGLTPLHWAAGNVGDSQGLSEVLLTAGADVNAMDNGSWTPLTEAEYYSQHDAAKLLRQHGGRDFVREIDDASKNGDLKKMKALLKNYPSLAVCKDKCQWTALHYAADWGQKDAAELLLANSAEVNATNCDKATPLHIAVAHGYKDVEELLRQRGGHE
jgi:cytohesin